MKPMLKLKCAYCSNYKSNWLIAYVQKLFVKLLLLTMGQTVLPMPVLVSRTSLRANKDNYCVSCYYCSHTFLSAMFETSVKLLEKQNNSQVHRSVEQMDKTLQCFHLIPPGELLNTELLIA